MHPKGDEVYLWPREGYTDVCHMTSWPTKAYNGFCKIHKVWEKVLPCQDTLRGNKQKVGISKKSEIVLKGIYCWFLSRMLPPSQVLHQIIRNIYSKPHTHAHTPVVFNIFFLPLLTIKTNSFRETVTHQRNFHLKDSQNYCFHYFA